MSTAAGGAVAASGELVLTTERLKAVRSLEPLLWRMEVEAGVTTRDVQRLARENGLLFPPDPGAAEQSHIDRMTRISVVGSASTVRRGLENLIDATGADELILTGQIFDHGARLRSFEIVSQVRETMAAPRLVPTDDSRKAVGSD